jgi:uncharacterized protein YxeA
MDNLEVHTMPDKFISGHNVNPQQQITPPPPHRKSSWIIIVIIIIAVLAILGGAGILLYKNLPLNSDQSNQNINNTNHQENKNTNKNLNSNKNSNINKNQNNNANKNSNANNSNTNSSNVNSNLNNNTNSAPIVTSGTDSDNDGLTNEEEKLFDTSASMPDTDKDGYKDGGEVINLYNPNGAGKIADSNLAKTYENEEYAYTILYPSKWIAQKVGETNKNVMFVSSDPANAGEFIEVITDNNPYGFSALDWYLDQNKNLKEEDVQEIEANGLKGVLSINGYTAYFTDSNNVYAVSYNYGTKTEVNFTSTFQMIYKSFKLTVKKKVKTNINANTNSNVNANNNTNE